MPLTTAHPADCPHCGRPENDDPFVIPGTPVELWSSETDAGRWRHWGGADLWVCREHPNFVGEDAPDKPSRYRLMEVFEASEHATLHRHGLVEEARALEVPLQSAALMRYSSEHRQRLAALDARGPRSG